MTDDPIIRASGITKSFGKFTALRGVDLAVARGSIHALLGPNGAGKTTMVRILSTLLRPDGGDATVAGHDLLRHPDRVRASISLTGQYAAVDELLTGEENLVMMGRLGRLGGRAARRRAVELLERFDLTDARRRIVRTYSGGMRRRLDLAASLVTEPPLIFLDEPTTGLDPRSRQAMWDMVRELAATAVTVLLTTQYLEEADRLADRITLVDGGRVIAEGTAEQLKAQVGDERVELRLAGLDDFDRAVRDLGDRAVRPDRDSRTVSVPTDGTAAQLRALLDTMAARDVAVTRVELHRPTLDDAFLALTGTATAGPTPATAPARTGGGASTAVKENR
ncbi:ATP-binding cassette domain-containing protein [Polymorphospora lycopeni]|uniref:ATP-binding cassette domain-containing protein n=1 Tax=Polymorphospora lycopeni TaxID=3140240 RepID=A0ABV5CUH6_9ACTN